MPCRATSIARSSWRSGAWSTDSEAGHGVAAERPGTGNDGGAAFRSAGDEACRGAVAGVAGRGSCSQAAGRAARHAPGAGRPEPVVTAGQDVVGVTAPRHDATRRLLDLKAVPAG